MRVFIRILKHFSCPASRSGTDKSGRQCAFLCRLARNTFGPIVASCALLVSASAFAVPPVPPIYATSAVVMDGSNGAILAAKNLDLQVANPSTTKIMTALLLLERAGSNLDQVVTVSSNAANAFG